MDKLLEEIEYKICNHELTKEQVFIRLKHIIQTIQKENEELGEEVKEWKDRTEMFNEFKIKHEKENQELKKFLREDVISFIKMHDEIVDGEWGECRKFNKLLEAGEESEIYHKTLEIIK